MLIVLHREGILRKKLLFLWILTKLPPLLPTGYLVKISPAASQKPRLRTEVDYATNLPVFGQAVHALPPLGSMLSFASSSFFMGMLLLMIMVTTNTIALMMSIALVAIVLRTIVLLASLVPITLPSFVTSLPSSLESCRTSPSLQIESLHPLL